MNKLDFAVYIAETEGISKTAAREYVEVVFKALGKILTSGEDVKVMGFGTFEQRERAARKGRNPQTGEEIEIAASKTIGLKLSDKLKDKIN